MLLDDGADQAICVALQACGDPRFESHSRIMHAGHPSPRRSEQRTEIDPHSWKVAYHGESGTRRAKKDGFPPRYELLAPASGRCDQPAHDQDNGERLRHEREGVVAQGRPYVAVKELPSCPGATAQRTPQPRDPVKRTEVRKSRRAARQCQCPQDDEAARDG